MLVQAEAIPFMKASRTSAAAIAVTFLDLPDDGRMQRGCKLQVGNRPSAGMHL